MPTIKLEINPEEFEKFAAEILERLRDAESQLESYRLLFAKSDSCADLDCELKAIREAVKIPVGQKYDLILSEVRQFLNGSLPADLFVKCKRELPSTVLMP